MNRILTNKETNTLKGLLANCSAYELKLITLFIKELQKDEVK